MPTLGASYKTVPVKDEASGRELKLNMWDTAGQEKFRSLTRMYYQDAKAAILVYDVTNQETFDSVKRWITELRENSNVPDCLIAIVGNKSDLHELQQVDIEQASNYAKQIGADAFMETSAKEDQGIKSLF